MLVVGLTGGIGAGKSAVATRLAGHGAVVVDADRVAREVVEPGTPGLAAVTAAFGPGVLRADGSLDRAALAGLVFADPVARRRLEAVTHPLIGSRTAELVALASADAVVVHDVPLLVEAGLAAAYFAVVVVEAPEPVRLARLAARGLPAEQARARIALQATDADRRAVATHLVDNAGPLELLDAQVDLLWQDLVRRQAAG